MSTKIAIAHYPPTFDLARQSTDAAKLYRGQWRELGRSFDARVIELTQDDNLDEILCSLRAKPILFHPKGKIPLSQFRQPKGRALYLFGPEDREIDAAFLDRFTSVRITTAEDYPLWGTVAAGIALANRWRR